MKTLLVALACVGTICFARNSYTGGYSGAPGRQACASSCHGGTGGTIVVTGFPATYRPGQVYRVVVRRNGGSLIVNYNATTRVGASTTVAGTFAVVTNSVLYTGADGGVYASPHSIDSSVFQWTAPAGGTGTVNFYCAGYQGTTSSANGQTTRITLAASEITTGVETQTSSPSEFSLSQNYPNPFNPATTIEFRVGESGFATLNVFDMAGKEVAALVNGEMQPGLYRVAFDASGLSSGIYFYRIVTKGMTQTRKMVVAK
jgi:hypothetical protein